MSAMHARAMRVAVAGALSAAALTTLRAQENLPPDKTQIADAVRADLSKLSSLERTYFSVNKRYTADLQELKFTPASGARIAVSYASARTFSASGAHVRLSPFLCFVIVSSPAGDSPAERPFCTDSRVGTAAAALASDAEPPATAPPPAMHRGVSASAPGVTPITVGKTDRSAVIPTHDTALNATQFAERLRAAALAPRDSAILVVQFAVKDARYDPSRGVLEVSLERVSLPPPVKPDAGAGASRPAFTCFTRPVFVCGADSLTYIARDIWHLPRARALDPETLRSQLTVQGRFAAGRRDDTSGPALTLLALVLQARGEALLRWEPAGAQEKR
jgi:hypothetical protein